MIYPIREAIDSVNPIAAVCLLVGGFAILAFFLGFTVGYYEGKYTNTTGLKPVITNYNVRGTK